MRMSELTEQEVLAFLRIEEAEGDIDPSVLLSAAKSYVRGYTGLSDEELDQHEDITVALLVLCSDMYENRLVTVESGNVNRVVDSLLGMHCNNLV